VTTRLIVIAAAVLIAWGMKRHYAGAAVEDLRWILRPTTGLVSVVTGECFTWQAGEGYVSRNRLFLIEKSCAGINFMVAAFGMLMFTFLHRAGSGRSAARVLGVSLLASYVSVVLVNAVRIAIAMWLAAHPVARSAVSAADVHRVEGIVVYFGGLVLLYGLVRRLDRPATSVGLALPLTAYYVVTLVIPILGGASSSSGFAGHAIVVLGVPVLLILTAFGVQTMARRS